MNGAFDPMAVGLTLAIKGTLVLLLGFGICGVLRRAGAAVRHLVWVAILVALVGLVPAGRLMPALPLPWLPSLASPTVAAGTTAAVETTVGAPARPATAAVPSTGPSSAAGAGSSSRRGAGAGAGASGVRPLAAVLLLVYLAGVLAVLVDLAVGLGRIHRLTRASEPAASDAGWSPLVAAADRRDRTEPGRPRARLLVSGSLAVPLTWGLFRPVVLLPADAGGWDARQRRYALLHELAHVERRDWAAQLVARLACALFWFHPLVWLASRRLVLEAEHACDDRVLCSGAESGAYAEQLLTLAKRLRGGARVALEAVPAVRMVRSSQLRLRILSILDPRRRRSLMNRPARLAVLALTFLPVLLIAPARLVPAASSNVWGPALLGAVAAGNEADVELLLAAGADVDAAVPGDGSALIVAAARGDLAMVRLLIAAGADVDLGVSGDGNPLIAAAGAGELEAVRLLVESGAEVDRVVPGDENALITASGRGRLEVVRYLIAQGADVNARVLANPGEYRTPLGYALRNGHRDVAEVLRAAGAVR